MCWSLEVSLASYIATLLLGLYLVRYSRPGTNDRWIGLFVLWFGLVQLFEALQWSDQECEKGINRAATIALFVVIIFEPLVHSLIALRHGNRPMLSLALVFASIAFAGYGILKGWPRDHQTCTRPETCNHLSWSWIQNLPPPFWPIFAVLITMPLLAMPRYAPIYIAFSFVIIAFAYAMHPRHEIGSMWCFYGIFAALIPLLIE